MIYKIELSYRTEIYLKADDDEEAEYYAYDLGITQIKNKIIEPNVKILERINEHNDIKIRETVFERNDI